MADVCVEEMLSGSWVAWANSNWMNFIARSHHLPSRPVVYSWSNPPPQNPAIFEMLPENSGRSRLDDPINERLRFPPRLHLGIARGIPRCDGSPATEQSEICLIPIKKVEFINLE